MAHEWPEGQREAERRQERAATEPLLKELTSIYPEAQTKRLAARTLQGYRERLEIFCLFRSGKAPHGNRLVRDFKPGDLSRFIRAKQASGCKPIGSSGFRGVTRSSIKGCPSWHPRQYLARASGVGVLS